MKTQTHTSKRLWFLGAVALLGGFAISFLAARHTANIRQQEQKPVTSKATLPKLISKVKKLEIVSAKISGEGEPGAVVSVEVKNNSDLAVTYFALTNGTIKTSEYGVSRDGLDVPGAPQVVIEPYGTATLNMSLISLDGKYPIVLSAAGFIDGAEEGDEAVIEHMRDVRARNKARREAEKDKAKQEAEKGVEP